MAPRPRARVPAALPRFNDFSDGTDLLPAAGESSEGDGIGRQPTREPGWYVGALPRQLDKRHQVRALTLFVDLCVGMCELRHRVQTMRDVSQAAAWTEHALTGKANETNKGCTRTMHALGGGAHGLYYRPTYVRAAHLTSCEQIRRRTDMRACGPQWKSSRT